MLKIAFQKVVVTESLVATPTKEEMKDPCTLCIYTIDEIDSQEDDSKNTSTLGLHEDAETEIELPPPTTFRRQNNQGGKGILSRIAARTNSEHTNPGLTPSDTASYRMSSCLRMAPDSKEGTRPALNYEEWRKVFEQCCK